MNQFGIDNLGRADWGGNQAFQPLWEAFALGKKICLDCWKYINETSPSYSLRTYYDDEE